MGRVKPIKKRFDGIEVGARNFHEDGDPMRHASIPEAWPFQGFEGAALVGFHADEPGAGIHELKEVKWISLKISDSADQIDRVEMGSRGKQLLLGFRFGIHLGLLDNLPGGGVLRVRDPKWASSRVAGIGHNAADPYGTV